MAITDKIDIDPLDLISPERYGQNGPPHDVWTRLRIEDPVHWCEPEGFENFWAVTKHAHIMEVASQPEVFCNSEGIVVLNDEQVAAMERDDNPLRDMRTIIEMDPPEHRVYRKIASGFFTPRGIDQLDEIVTNSARTLVDSLGEEGECDMIERLAQRHPLRVLATILGVDRDDEERMLELTQQLFAPDDPDLQRDAEDRNAAVTELGLEFYAMFDRIIQDRKAHPREDLATLLATAMLPGGEEMGPIETFGYYLIVFTAGHDTTRNALSGALNAFAQFPDEFARLKADPSLLKSAVEEVVRWSTPVNYMKRTALVDTELHGRRISAGERLVLFYASANRDEEVFDRPFTFDITRQPNRHLGFGWAEHFCLGAHLARASITALVNELSARVETLEFVEPPRQIASSFVVGLKTLPVRYRIRPAG
ncbi:MAG: cytochrome P450 [Acidimicrobiales bacterium]|nr:cytochrome P450 [Acidimicrobiales bacterium]